MRKFSSNFPNKSLLYPCIRTISKAKNKVTINNNQATWNIELLHKLFQRFCSRIFIFMLFWVNIPQRWFHFPGLNEQIGVDFTEILSTRFHKRSTRYQHVINTLSTRYQHVFINDLSKLIFLFSDISCKKSCDEFWMFFFWQQFLTIESQNFNRNLISSKIMKLKISNFIIYDWQLNFHHFFFIFLQIHYLSFFKWHLKMSVIKWRKNDSLF